MEQPCYKCGQIVDEGVPFCVHCSAPQIRVVIAEPVVPPPAFAAATASQDSVALPASQTLPVLALPMQWSEAFKPSALAALVASLLMMLGLNPFVAMFSVGFLAVVFFRQRRQGPTVKPGTGARLGALSGFFCFAITALLTALASTVSDFRTKIREQILENVEKWAGSRPADPQIQAALDQLKTPEGFITALILASILFFVLSILLASLGGALGGVILGRRDKS
jgi:small-conductance mechanosensitive channel